ncbi:hypothetical protein ACRQ5D_28840 [Mucilaginibacter sp. P25]|uniref:hypothetical protein n=1 Tax=unclassified Mucilaginibacter TaxID=2617802 RepID=UPI003D665349
MTRNDKSPHILNAASNLLGLCFVVLTSLKFLKMSDRTYIDENSNHSTCFLYAKLYTVFSVYPGKYKTRWTFGSRGRLPFPGWDDRIISYRHLNHI